ncbi:MAG TPA: cysteine-rich CWC family protein [Pseudomonas sp.]|nr:cysteine-rich CWC family protein [Pseudomonas sp.]
MSDPHRCPRCGQLNNCAQAGQDHPVEDCWCFHQSVEPSVLADLPIEQRDRDCLCPRCAQGLPVAPEKAD